MDADTAPSLADLINQQLGRASGTPLPGGITVRPELLWALLAVGMTPHAPPLIEDRHLAAE